MIALDEPLAQRLGQDHSTAHAVTCVSLVVFCRAGASGRQPHVIEQFTLLALAPCVVALVGGDKELLVTYPKNCLSVSVTGVILIVVMCMSPRKSNRLEKHIEPTLFEFTKKPCYAAFREKRKLVYLFSHQDKT